ncbi:MAG: hypothetical protein M1819_000086 [Sarea resinae]|nr:MAG: hypothetical protein M1819_000086 [Sarea resinae]
MLAFFQADARRARDQDFYSRTLKAMDAKAKGSDFDVSKHLSDAESAAKVAASKPHPQPEVLLGEKGMAAVADEKAAAAEEKTGGKPKNLKGGEKWDVSGGASASGKEEIKEPVKEKTQEEQEVEVELNGILKRSPIIIFSKSYCPFSQKAKHTLLEKYTIVPAPFVVELDTHPLGPQLQASLQKMTGRRTVPNILISGRSIGGSDEVADLDSKGALVDKVRRLGGKRIMEIKLT